MNNVELTPVMLERASEQLRQERETFNQAKKHDSNWFVLRLVMGYASVILLVCIMVIASYILYNNDKFPATVVVSAGASLFVDVLGLLAGIWKITFNPASMSKLNPVTNSEMFKEEHT